MYIILVLLKINVCLFVLFIKDRLEFLGGSIIWILLAREFIFSCVPNSANQFEFLVRVPAFIRRQKKADSSGYYKEMFRICIFVHFTFSLSLFYLYCFMGCQYHLTNISNDFKDDCYKTISCSGLLRVLYCPVKLGLSWKLLALVNVVL